MSPKPDQNIQKLSDEKLLQSIRQLVQHEREILLQVLKHLAEIDRRRLFCVLRCGSLFEYATKHLCYREDQAARRIAAMRLMREIPEIEPSIGSGELNLTHLGLAQTFFRKEGEVGGKPLSKSYKYELMMTLKGQSTRAAAQTIANEQSPEGRSKAELQALEKITALGDGKFLLQIVVEENVLNKLEILKGLRAHRMPETSNGLLLEELCEVGLEAEKQRRMGRLIPAAPRVIREPEQVRLVARKRSSASIRREVWQRDQLQCRNCGGHDGLELDHIQPRALGGTSRKENLRVLCHKCNQRAAIEKFGLGKMQKYLLGQI